MLALTSIGLGCPKVSLNGMHLKELDFQHLGSCFQGCIEKHIWEILRNIGTYIYSEIHLFQSLSFVVVYNNGFPRVSSCTRVWFTMIPFRDAYKLFTLVFYNLFCMFFLYYKSHANSLRAFWEIVTL